MATYTDNNNAISLLSVQGAPGPIGFTGDAGDTGAQGTQGTQGPKGSDSYVSTDIMFSGDNPGYKLIYYPYMAFVGGFIFDRQEDITSVKVLVGAETKTGLNAEVWLGLLAWTPDSNGNPFLAEATSVLSGSGKDQDSAIIDLTLNIASFNNIMDPTFLLAYIKPTAEDITDILKRLSNDGYTDDEVIKYKEQVFELPYSTDADSVYNRLEANYNIMPGSISGKKQTSLDAIKVERAAEAASEPTLPKLEKTTHNNQLKVYYLKIT